MTPTVSILVPYRPDGGARDAAWEWIRPLLELVADSLGGELLVESPGPGSSPADFNHPAAINAARRRASGDVLVVQDADTLPPTGPWLYDAARIIDRGEAPWVLPARYVKLSEDYTRRLLTAKEGDIVLLTDDDEEWVGHGASWSGAVVVSADAFDEVGGYDERWAWWGSDDAAFAITMSTLVGAPIRLEGECLHFWHPAPLEETYGHERRAAQREVCKAYEAAAAIEDPAARRVAVRRAVGEVVIANDVVETIGELAEEWGDADVGEILVGLGLAPDEIGRLSMVAGWSVERVLLSFASMALDGLPTVPPEKLPWAAWLDGFSIGLAVARRSAR